MFLKFGIVKGITRMGSLNHPSFIHTLYFSPVPFALRIYAFYLKFEMYRFSNRSSRIKKISGAKNEVEKRTSGESYFAHQERGYEVAAGPYLTQEYPYLWTACHDVYWLNNEKRKKNERMKDENAMRVSSALRSSARYQNNGSENDKRKGAATDADV